MNSSILLELQKTPKKRFFFEKETKNNITLKENCLLLKIVFVIYTKQTTILHMDVYGSVCIMAKGYYGTAVAMFDLERLKLLCFE